MNNRLVLSLSISVFLGGTYLLACGGDDSATISGDDGGTSDGTTQGDGNGTGDDESSVDSGGGTDSGNADTGSDTGSGGDSANDSPSDAPLDVFIAQDGGPIVDAAPGGDGATLSCGAAACSVPSQACCFYQGISAGFTVGCSNGAQCPLPAPPDAGDAGDAGPFDSGVTVTSLDCEQTANCPSNNVCCLEKNVTNGNTIANCKLSCAGSGSVHAAYLCDPSLADAGCGALTDAGVCSSTNGTWGLPNGDGTCSGKVVELEFIS